MASTMSLNLRSENSNETDTGVKASERLFAIIHEDTELLVINKPAGLVCHPTKTDAYSSLISRARLYLGGPGRARCNLESAQGRTQAGQGRAGVPPAFPEV